MVIRKSSTSHAGKTGEKQGQVEKGIEKERLQIQRVTIHIFVSGKIDLNS